MKNYIDGAIIRCGYGSDYAHQDDKRFIQNVEACIQHGIPFGVYLYSYANTINAAKSEEPMFLDYWNHTRMIYPIRYIMTWKKQAQKMGLWKGH